MAAQTSEHGRVIYLAIELSSSIWLLAAHLPGTAKPKLYRIGAGDTAALLALVTSLRAHVQAGLGAAIEVASCFEAGRDGFWLHRLSWPTASPAWSRLAFWSTAARSGPRPTGSTPKACPTTRPATPAARRGPS